MRSVLSLIMVVVVLWTIGAGALKASENSKNAAAERYCTVLGCVWIPK